MEISESGSMRCGVKSNLQCWLFPVRSVQRQNFYFPYFDHVKVISFSTYEKEREREISLCRNNISHPAGFEDRVLRLILLLLVSCSSHSGKIRQQWKQKSLHGTPRHAMPHVHAYTQEWTSVKILSSEANERASGFSGGPLFFRDSQWDDY